MGLFEKGYCQCGCGQKTNIAKKTSKFHGHTKGEPIKFIQGHQLKGERNPRWNNGKTTHCDGYILVKMPNHPRANKHTGYVYEHILKAEKALGNNLPLNAEVHHLNCTTDSGPLVICQNKAYHMLLHMRTKALQECGHANWHKCQFCRIYDDPRHMYAPNKGTAYHRECRNQALKKKRNESIR